MNDNNINICVFIPAKNDNRTAAEREAMLAKFHQLHAGIEFTFCEYSDGAEVRAIRGQADFDRARAMVDPVSEELKATLAKAHIILCVDLPFDMHELAPQLRWVQSVGAGVGQLQHAGLDKLDCQLSSGAGITASSISEFVLARMLAHWKRFAEHAEHQRKHQWQPVYSRELAGCTLGIVGYGAIGRAMAQKAKALGMQVLATRRQPCLSDNDPHVDQMFAIEDLHDLLQHCDAVMLSAAETTETFHLFDEAAFNAMPGGSYFCNVSRGSLVDEQALAAALSSGHLSAASIDVAQQEPLPAEHFLWDAPNLEISAHCSPALENFTRHMWQLFYDNTKRFLAGEPLVNQRSTSAE